MFSSNKILLIVFVLLFLVLIGKVVYLVTTGNQPRLSVKPTPSIVPTLFVTPNNNKIIISPTENSDVSDVIVNQDEKGQILKGQVVKYDTVSLTVAIEGNGEMNFSDLNQVSVWVIKNDTKGERPQKSDWSKIAVGQRISLSMDKSGQKLISVIVYK